MGKVSRRSAVENESIDWKKASRNSLQRIFRQVMGKKLGSMDILASTTFSTYKAYQEVLGVKVLEPAKNPPINTHGWQVGMSFLWCKSCPCVGVIL